MKIDSLKYNGKTVRKIYQADELVKKMNYGQSSDVFQYIKNDGDTPTPPAPVPYDEQYLTIESTSDNNAISLVASRTNITKTVSASTDNGNTWTEYTSSTGGTQIATLNTGDKVLVKGENSAYASYFTSFMKMYNYFTSSGQFNAYGNIMSLISGDSFENADELTENYTFGGLFSGCTGLTSAENLVLPATTLSKSCYYYMFNGCTSLTTAPELPATTLSESCYDSMFNGCTSLTVAPELPATTLTLYCYSNMFQGCTSLTTAPELPATASVGSCYRSMFQGCTSLTVAPELPATTLTLYCYRSMFQGCTSLTVAPELPATTLAESCYQSMFSNCTSLTTVPELPALTLIGGCYREMFDSCTSLTVAPKLPATTLANGCYGSMFRGCTSLNYIKCLANDISARQCTTKWVDGVAATGTFVKNAAMSGWTTGIAGIPDGWTIVNA